MNKLPEQVRHLRHDAEKMLLEVEPSDNGFGLRMYPCEVQLDDEAWLDRVYIVDADHYIRSWAWWPWSDGGKQWVPAERIVAIRSSPKRLPARFANELYAAGESGMGYCAFSVGLKDGRRLHYVTGNAVDFPAWPEGVFSADVCGVFPHDRLPEHRHRAPTPSESSAQYWWSPYRPRSEDEMFVGRATQ